jgi:hypothetical protein
MHHLPRFISSLLSMHGSTGVAGADAAVTGIIAFLLLAFVAVLAIVVIILVSLWIVYKKAGRSGWAAIIPFYNYTVMLEMVKKPLWWILLIFFVPVVNIVFSIIVLRRKFWEGRLVYGRIGTSSFHFLPDPRLWFFNV